MIRVKRNVFAALYICATPLPSLTCQPVIELRIAISIKRWVKVRTIGFLPIGDQFFQAAWKNTGFQILRWCILQNPRNNALLSLVFFVHSVLSIPYPFREYMVHKHLYPFLLQSECGRWSLRQWSIALCKLLFHQRGHRKNRSLISVLVITVRCVYRNHSYIKNRVEENV